MVHHQVNQYMCTRGPRRKREIGRKLIQRNNGCKLSQSGKTDIQVPESSKNTRRDDSKDTHSETQNKSSKVKRHLKTAEEKQP